MGSQTPATPTADRRKSGSRNEGPAWTWFLIIVTLSLIGGIIIFSGRYIPSKSLYKPGDDVGFYLGLVGGVMMLVMLLYPLRKRVAFMKKLGILPTWFRWHMVLGILGPATVLFHSTFTIHSFNAGVALICMLLVSGSGIFGRFFYTKIHRGLYGRQVTLQGMQEEMTKTGSYNRSFHTFAPQIENSLDKFRVRAEKIHGGFLDFFTIGFQAFTLTKSLTQELHQVMYSQAHEKNWDAGAIKKNVDELFEDYSSHISVFIKSFRDAAQFRTYERLFSLWHIFHIPLVYMMVFSGFYHVYAVVFAY
jgi:hypothetical protein